MRLIIDYPWFFLLFCLLAGGCYSALLYFRTVHFSPALRWCLAGVRFVVVALTSFLLLSPMVRMERHEKERPVVVVAQDNSRSVAMTKDSVYYRTAYLDALRQLTRRLDHDCEVRFYCYAGEAVEGDAGGVDYCGDATDLSALFREVGSRYRHRNLCAVVVAGDGLYNRGVHPAAEAGRLMVPVYAVAMGDTTVRRDAAVVHVRHNQRVALHDRFPIEVTLRATNMRGIERTFRLIHNGQVLASKQVAFNSDDFVLTETFLVEADAAGLQQYTLALDVAAGEYNPHNNRRTVTVEVADRRRKIVILASAPHPDVAALRQSFTSSRDCEVSFRLVQPAGLTPAGMPLLKRAVASADLVVLHNLSDPELYRELQSLCKPVMHILGEGADLSRFNAMRSGIEVRTRLAKSVEATASGRTDFIHFDVPDALRSAIEQLPPLQSPFGDYHVQPHVQPLFYAKIGGVVSGQPLVALSTAGARQVWVMGDGLWRWRLTDYRTDGSHERFDQLFNKLAVFAASQPDASRFRIVSQPRYCQGEQVVLEAELYDNNGELTQQQPVTVSWRPSAGDTELSQPAVRTPGHRTYSANLGLLPAGTYRCQASTVFDGESLTAAAAFVVEDFDIEAVNLVADHALLRTLAHTTGGAVVPADSVMNLLPLLHRRTDMKPLISSQMRYDELLRLPWLLAVLLLLLSVEWLVRKYNGRL